MTNDPLLRSLRIMMVMLMMMMLRRRIMLIIVIFLIYGVDGHVVDAHVHFDCHYYGD